jgi:hypothetical protein
MSDVTSLPRGCGYRIAGGVYAECNLSPNGRPLNEFIVDPPIVVNEADLQLPKRGNVLREWRDVWHLFDRIGEQFYPNVADKVEEIRARGESRRLNARSIDFSKITRDTRLVLLHPRAHIVNVADYYQGFGECGLLMATATPTHWACPKSLPRHQSPAHLPREMCAGVWWRDLVEGVVPTDDVDRHAPLKRVRREMPGQSYFGWARPDGVTPAYQTAIFLILPLTRIAVVRGVHGEHDAPLKAASKAKVSVELVDE